MDYSIMYDYAREEMKADHETALHAVAMTAVHFSISANDFPEADDFHDELQKRFDRSFWEQIMLNPELYQKVREIWLFYSENTGRSWHEHKKEKAA